MLLLQGFLKPLCHHSARYLRIHPAAMVQVGRLHTSAPAFKLSDDIKTSLKSIPDIKHAPAPALFYGFSGLIPFTAIPAYMFQSGAYIPELAFTSLAYGAVILSFLGGVRWGTFLTNPQAVSSGWKELGWAVSPALLGWTSLLVSNLTGALLLISAFSFCMVQDSCKCSHYPSWYKSMRIVLSSLVIMTLVATLMGRYLLPLESEKKAVASS